MRRWETGEIKALIALYRRGLRQLDIARLIDRPPGSVGNLVAKLARQGKLRFRQPAFGHSRASDGPEDRAVRPVRDGDP
jgi:hypothetical protein